MTDENTLRTDSVVEAAERMRSMAAHEVTCGLPVEDFTEDDWRNLAKAALAAQPRDDVRELSAEELRFLAADAMRKDGVTRATITITPTGCSTQFEYDTALAPTTQGTDSGLAGELVERQREFVEYHRHQAQTYIALGDRIKPEQRTSLSYHITKMSEGMETLCTALRAKEPSQ